MPDDDSNSDNDNDDDESIDRFKEYSISFVTAGLHNDFELIAKLGNELFSKEIRKTQSCIEGLLGFTVSLIRKFAEFEDRDPIELWKDIIQENKRNS